MSHIAYKELFDDDPDEKCNNCRCLKTDHFTKSIKRCESCHEKMTKCPTRRSLTNTGRNLVCYNKNCEKCFSDRPSKEDLRKEYEGMKILDKVEEGNDER